VLYGILSRSTAGDHAIKPLLMGEMSGFGLYFGSKPRKNAVNLPFGDVTKVGDLGDFDVVFASENQDAEIPRQAVSVRPDFMLVGYPP